ncbi:YadA family autotransporter adhesin [Acinetobacter sp.]|uniref:YadA family autotransporter adhesin n=1 Tax=Acinetobacter sp. TaxID=472 RepID=UPI0035B33E59
MFGVGSVATAKGATAIGYDSFANEENTVSVGRAGAEKRITNVADPIRATDVANKRYVDQALTGFTGNADTVLYKTGSNKEILTLAGMSGTKITNLQNGTADNDAVNLGQLKTKADQTALTTGLSNTLTDAKGYTDVEVGKLDTKLGAEVGNLDTKITTNKNAITALDGRVDVAETDIALLKTNTGNLGASAVIYDDATTKDLITLKGTTGTKITNLKDATLDANSTDAVTGKQLHATNTNITALGDRVTTEVGVLNTKIGNEVTALDTKIGQNTTAIDTLGSRVTTEVGNLNTAITNTATTINTRIINEVGMLNTTISGIDGRVTTNTQDIAALQSGLGGISANAVVYDSAAKDTVTFKGTKLTGLKDATLDANSTDAVTGKQLHETNSNVTTLDGRVTSEVATLNTRVNTGNAALASALGGSAAWNNGVFTAPTYTIQEQAKTTVSDAFIAVDQQLGSIKTSVSDLKTSTDQQAASNLNDAKNYADQQTTAALNNAKAYTDKQTTSALNDAKSYTDQKAADGKAYTDQQTASALNDAKSYADQKAASSLSGAKDYTDQKTASAISSANSYTDSKIADVQNQLTANNQFVQVNGVANTQAASATGENSVAIGANTVVTGNRSTAVGVGNQVSGNGSGAFGDPNIVAGNGSYAVGNDNKITGDNTFVLGNNVDTKAKNAVVLGNDSASDRDNTVSVGAKGKERQIIHVADATEDTDAVNYKQLKAVESSANTYTNDRVNALNSAFQDYRMETEQRFQKVDERFNRQGAMTAAMMNMSSSAASVKGRNRIGVGAGFQGQEQAVSVGYQRLINENTSLSIGGAFTEKESSGGVGVGFGW